MAIVKMVADIHCVDCGVKDGSVVFIFTSRLIARPRGAGATNPLLLMAIFPFLFDRTKEN